LTSAGEVGTRRSCATAGTAAIAERQITANVRRNFMRQILNSSLQI
jgi:hypothetical protein